MTIQTLPSSLKTETPEGTPPSLQDLATELLKKFPARPSSDSRTLELSCEKFLAELTVLFKTQNFVSPSNIRVLSAHWKERLENPAGAELPKLCSLKGFRDPFLKICLVYFIEQHPVENAKEQAFDAFADFATRVSKGLGIAISDTVTNSAERIRGSIDNQRSYIRGLFATTDPLYHSRFQLIMQRPPRLKVPLAPKGLRGDEVQTLETRKKILSTCFLTRASRVLDFSVHGNASVLRTERDGLHLRNIIQAALPRTLERSGISPEKLPILQKAWDILVATRHETLLHVSNTVLSTGALRLPDILREDVREALGIPSASPRQYLAAIAMAYDPEFLRLIGKLETLLDQRKLCPDLELPPAGKEKEKWDFMNWISRFSNPLLSTDRTAEVKEFVERKLANQEEPSAESKLREEYFTLLLATHPLSAFYSLHESFRKRGLSFPLMEIPSRFNKSATCFELQVAACPFLEETCTKILGS